MKKIKACIIVMIPIIATFLVGMVSVGAKSYVYTLNYGKYQKAEFTKYNCENDVHSAIWSYSLNGAKQIRVETALSHDLGNDKFDPISSTIQIIDKEEAGYGLSFEKTGGGNLHIVWTNKSSGTTLYGKFFLNNGAE